MLIRTAVIRSAISLAALSVSSAGEEREGRDGDYYQVSFRVYKIGDARPNEVRAPIDVQNVRTEITENRGGEMQGGKHGDATDGFSYEIRYAFFPHDGSGFPCDADFSFRFISAKGKEGELGLDKEIEIFSRRVQLQSERSRPIMFSKDGRYALLVEFQKLIR